MAKRSGAKSGSKTVLWIIVALIVLVALLVALAFTPVGDKIIEVIEERASTSSDDGDTTGGNTSGGDTSGGNAFSSLGSPITSPDGATLLDEVVFEAHFIDVGQGDAILLLFNDGTSVMIDAGSGTTAYSNTQGYQNEMVAYVGEVLGDLSLDYLIITHPDTDHYNMADGVLEAFDVANIYYNDCDKDTRSYINFKAEAAAETGANIVPIDSDGETYTLFDSESYSMTIYAPGYDRFNPTGGTDYGGEVSNGMSPMIIVETASRTLLFTGDATTETEEWFMDTYAGELDVDFIKIGHHGSTSSTSEAFLDLVTPEYCVIMCDDGEAYGHPAATVMNRLFDRGIVTYRTNRHGNITLFIDSDGDMAFNVENHVPVENNTVTGRSDLMLQPAA